ncbi:MAG: hypothetical protein R3C03_05685 [Pirellulaceae bacterium]
MPISSKANDEEYFAEEQSNAQPDTRQQQHLRLIRLLICAAILMLIVFGFNQFFNMDAPDNLVESNSILEAAAVEQADGQRFLTLTIRQVTEYTHSYSGGRWIIAFANADGNFERLKLTTNPNYAYIGPRVDSNPGSRFVTSAGEWTNFSVGQEVDIGGVNEELRHMSDDEILSLFLMHYRLENDYLTPIDSTSPNPHLSFEPVDGLLTIDED